MRTALLLSLAVRIEDDRVGLAVSIACKVMLFSGGSLLKVKKDNKRKYHSSRGS